MDKLLPPGVSISDAGQVQLMKVKVESHPTREEAERIIEANRSFYQGELRTIVSSGADVFEIWKPLAKLSIDFLPLAKRGDLIRFLLKTPDESEFVTCVVTSRTSNGLLRCRVYSRPEKTRLHTVEYGDELTVAENQVVTHEVSSDQIVKDLEPFLTGTIPEAVPVNIEDAKLRAATKNLPAVAPEKGRQYWTRNGTLVTVWTQQLQQLMVCPYCGRQNLGSQVGFEQCSRRNDSGPHVWSTQGRWIWIGGGSDGSTLEWNADGSHAGGIRDLDIVKDPKMNEVLA